MITAVRYFSRSGNTKKLAEAISAAAETTAETTDTGLSEPVELLFLGGAIYAGGIDKHLRDFALGLTGETVKAIAVFNTAAGNMSIRGQIAELLKGKGISLLDHNFVCKGKFLFTNKGRPNEQDLAEASVFAKNCLSGRDDIVAVHGYELPSLRLK
jgi:flavodoxin